MKNKIATTEVPQTVQTEIEEPKTRNYRKVASKVGSALKTGLAIYGAAVIVTLVINAVTSEENEEV